MNQKLRAFLEANGLRATATEQEAWALYDKLQGDGVEVPGVDPGQRAAAGGAPPPAAGGTPEPARQEQTPPASPDVDAAVTRALAQDAQRRTDIDERLRVAGLIDADNGAFARSLLANPDCTVERASQAIFARMKKDNPPIGTGAFASIPDGGDELDKARAAKVEAILYRAGVIKVANIGSNNFRGYKLLDLARMSLERMGIATGNMDQMQLVGRAFTQGASDFPVLLEEAMYKAMLSGFKPAALTWQRFCASGSVNDFRAHNRYRVGSFGNLDALTENNEFKDKTIPDGEKASVTIGTKGNIINLSRKAIINDDLGAFVNLSVGLARAAARSVEADVYALLLENAGLGPVMADTKTLFHADHGNISAGAALSIAAIDADRVAMASQMDISDSDYLDLRPAVLVVPLSLGGTAREVNAAEYNDEATKNQRRPNTVRGLFRDVVDTPRLTGTRRYLFADPADAPVIEVDFLDGNETPYLEMQEGFGVDGVKYKVRYDYGVTAVDYRGAVTNAGA